MVDVGDRPVAAGGEPADRGGSPPTHVDGRSNHEMLRTRSRLYLEPGEIELLAETAGGRRGGCVAPAAPVCQGLPSWNRWVPSSQNSWPIRIPRST